jgi:hypothetical protein
MDLAQKTPKNRVRPFSANYHNFTRNSEKCRNNAKLMNLSNKQKYKINQRSCNCASKTLT